MCKGNSGGHRLPTLLVLCAVLPWLASPAILAQDTAEKSAWAGDGPWVVRITVSERQVIDELRDRLDVWAVEPEEGHAVALVTRAELEALRHEGFEVSLDKKRTASLAKVGVPEKLQLAGIPGFPCYRTVEETYATADAIVAAHPDLATLFDIGDSWEKTQNAAAGFDLRVLRLTRSAVPGPKPKLFGNFAIHAREYTTAELGTRFAELLVNNYGVDPDVTWILDHHEIHLNLVANPDGRKQAETGLSWRKNTNNDYCSNTDSRGADLNRNFQFQWNCCGGSSTNQCSTTFNGAGPASEPETTAIQDYLVSIFPDQRDPALSSPAPDDATGVMLDVHSFGEDVLWSWGFTTTDPPNDPQLWTLGRKYAFFTGYRPQSGSLSTVDGATKDFSYGELGVPGYTIELGTQFFEDCTVFESQIAPDNLPALLYTAKIVRTPYLTPAGPEALGAAVSPASVTAGELVTLSATVDDTRYDNSNGTEPTQTIASAEAYVALPPWDAGAVPIAMSASDGTFDEGAESVEVTIDTTGLDAGRHLLFVRGFDTDGNTGSLTAAFLDVAPPCTVDADCDDGLFCNGAEVCGAGVCQAGADPCPGESCDEAGDVCTPLICDDDGVCEAGEDCLNCPGDCPSFPIPAASCGNGLCEAGDGEDCVSCPQDCDGVQGGKPGNRFCCGFGGEGAVGCGDSRCTSGGFDCTEIPQGTGGSTCCGDLACEAPEDGFSCELDCGAPPFCGDGTCDAGEDACSCATDCGAPAASEAGLCTDGLDNDCDGVSDCADPDCDGVDPACQVDCAAFGDKSSCNAQPACSWDNPNKVCLAV